MSAILEELRRAPLLSQLECEQLERVSRHAARLQLDAEQLLFSQGDAATRFYLLLSGRIQLYRLSPDGGEKVIEIVSPGQTFAEALMFLNRPRYPVCAAALMPSELLALDAADFTKMLRESVTTCFLMLGALSQRLRGLIGEIDDLTLHTATSRVARYLAARLAADADDITLDVRKGVLASRLSVQPETFSRVIKTLTERGVIRMQGNSVAVLDRAQLRQIGEVDEILEEGPLAIGSLGSLRP